jgi:hypothetical protein
MTNAIDSLHSLCQKIKTPFSFQENLHADYGWCSLTHFAKRVEDSNHLALKILANFADATLGFGIVASAVYNPSAYLYNSILEAKNQSIDSWNQKVTLRREVVQELLLALGAAIPSAILQRFYSDSPTYWHRSLLIWTYPLLFNNVLRIIQPNNTGKIRSLIDVMKKVSLVAVAELTINGWIHEFGHLLCSNLLLQYDPPPQDSQLMEFIRFLFDIDGPHPFLRNPSSIIWVGTHYLVPFAMKRPTPGKLSVVGQFVGEKKASLLITAAGPLLSLAFSISQMIFAHSLEKGFVKSVLSANANAHAFIQFFYNSVYPLVWEKKHYASGDFGKLWRKGNIHPLTSFFATYVLPMSLQFYLWNR